MLNLIKELGKTIKPTGYKKTNLIWRKSNEDLVYLLNLQPSRFNGSDDESFTINIGIFSYDVHKLIWDKELAQPTEPDCIFRKRISYFLNTNTDVWWQINNRNFETIASEVKGVINEKVLPFFSKITNQQDLYDLLSNLPQIESSIPLLKIQAGVLAYLINQEERSLKILNEVKNDKVWGENASNAIERLKGRLRDSA